MAAPYGRARADCQRGRGTAKTQRQKFEEAARELETDDDPARFDERMKKLVRQKPVPEKPE